MKLIMNMNIDKIIKMIIYCLLLDYEHQFVLFLVYYLIMNKIITYYGLFFWIFIWTLHLLVFFWGFFVWFEYQVCYDFIFFYFNFDFWHFWDFLRRFLICFWVFWIMNMRFFYYYFFRFEFRNIHDAFLVFCFLSYVYLMLY